MLLSCALRTLLLLVLHGSIAVPPTHLHSAPSGVRLYQVAAHAPFVASFSSFVFGVVNCTVLATSRCNIGWRWPWGRGCWRRVSWCWRWWRVCSTLLIIVELYKHKGNNLKAIIYITTSIFFMCSGLSKGLFYTFKVEVIHKLQGHVLWLFVTPPIKYIGKLILDTLLSRLMNKIEESV